MKKILNESRKKTIFFYICLVISIIALYSGIMSAFHKDSKRKFFSLGLFTRQNTFFVNLVLFCHFFKKKINSKFLSYLDFNCFVNCIVVFIFCFTKYETGPYFFEHKLLPLTFCFYYLFIDQNFILWNEFYTGFIYVLTYSLISIIIYYFKKDLFPYLKECEPYTLLQKLTFIFSSFCSIILFTFFKSKRLKCEYNL
ncbi:hypothetical protein [Columbia Basin potato purple top phytoplasma]|uniref:Sequence-variable mosaic (SVM) signal sequence domain-containing protein n=1 Tax=Columbia Basin potato purple top phytoplasma TaxID=307134 RepID=A0ABT5LAP6_9MOLU|nr:hypothetical protein [Columbia Basin potato purple top phytoplasma]MDC9032209.1 hypothetical protein [Columbia Basin potato purple top phytoplasma]